MHKVTNFFLLFLLLCVSVCIAQKGFITGRVVDIDGNPIPGALVRIKQLQLITYADRNGEYSFPQIQKKRYGIEFIVPGYIPKSAIANVRSYRGTTVYATLKHRYYQDHNIPGIKGQKRRAVIKNVLYKNSVIQDEQIEVLAQKIPHEQQDIASVAQNFANIKNLRINNHTQTLIQGLPAKYADITLDGDPILTNDNVYNSVDLGLFDTANLMAINYTKTPLPSMNGNATAGQLNLATYQNTSEHRNYVEAHGQLPASFTFSDGAYRFNALTSGRYFKDRIGVTLAGGQQGDVYRDSYIDYKYKDTVVSKQSLYANRIKNIKGTFYSSVDLKISNKHRIRGSVFQNINVSSSDSRQLSWETKDGNLKLGTFNKNRNQTKLNTISYTKYWFSGTHWFLNLFKVDWKTAFAIGANATPLSKQLQFKNANTYTFNTRPKGNANKLALPEDFDLSTTENGYEINRMNIFSQNILKTQQIQQIKLNIPITVKDRYNKIPKDFVKGFFEFGYKRTFNSTRNISSYIESSSPLYKGVNITPKTDIPQDNSIFDPRAGSFNIGQFYTSQALADISINSSTTDAQQVNYQIKDEIQAQYGMMQFYYNKALLIMLGYRYELFHRNIDSSNDIRYSEFLPNIQLRYNMKNKYFIKFAYFKTHQIPDNQYSINTIRWHNFFQQKIIVNTKLTNELTHHFNLSYQRQTASIGVFDIGLYFKSILGYAYPQSLPNSTTITYRNAQSYTMLYGGDFSMNKTLDFLPWFLKDITTSLNTYVSFLAPSEDTGLDSVINSLTNIGLQYEDKSLFVKCQMIYNTNTTEINPISQVSYIHEPALTLNSFVGYSFLKKWSLYLNYKNMLNARTQQIYENSTRIYLPVSSIRLGLRYNF